MSPVHLFVVLDEPLDRIGFSQRSPFAVLLAGLSIAYVSMSRKKIFSVLCLRMYIIESCLGKRIPTRPLSSSCRSGGTKRLPRNEVSTQRKWQRRGGPGTRRNGRHQVGNRRESRKRRNQFAAAQIASCGSYAASQSFHLNNGLQH